MTVGSRRTGNEAAVRLGMSLLEWAVCAWTLCFGYGVLYYDTLLGCYELRVN